MPAYAFNIGATAGFSAEFGGDDLFTVTKINPDTQETKDVTLRAGDGMNYFAGLRLYNVGQLETQINFSAKIDSATGSNGYYSFYRYPVEVLQFVEFPVGGGDGRISSFIKLGGGLAYHRSPTVMCEVENACTGDIKGTATKGYIGQVDWVVKPTDPGELKELRVGVRFTSVSYDFGNGFQFNGNSWGIVVGLGM